jgi:hypothetical protein
MGCSLKSISWPTVRAFGFDHLLYCLSGCVMENKEPLTPGEEGLRDLTIMMGIYEAARSSKTLKL